MIVKYPQRSGNRPETDQEDEIYISHSYQRGDFSYGYLGEFKYYTSRFTLICHQNLQTSYQMNQLYCRTKIESKVFSLEKL